MNQRDSTNLDFMRAVAVLLVVSAHLLLYLGKRTLDGWSGITGVAIFFVHTTLVLMFSLERDADVGRFLIRRIFRIYPLWLVILALTLLIRLPMMPQFAPNFGYLAPTIKNLVAHILLVFNLTRMPILVGASWTLPVEMQMYLFLPFLFFFARSVKLLWPLLLIDGFVMLYAREHTGTIDSSLLTLTPYFIPGVMAYVLSKRSDSQVLPAALFPVFLFALIAVDHFYGSFHGGWLFCLILGLGVTRFKDMQNKWVCAASRVIARYSYGIYLCHIAAICVGLHYLAGYNIVLRVAAFLLTCFGAPVALYHLVEAPALRFGSKLARRLLPEHAPKRAEMQLEPVP